MQNNRSAPSYTHNVHCLNNGYSTSCYGTSTPNNNLTNLAEAIVGLSSILLKSQDLDDYFSSCGYILAGSQKARASYTPSAQHPEQQLGEESLTLTTCQGQYDIGPSIHLKSDNVPGFKELP